MQTDGLDPTREGELRVGLICNEDHAVFSRVADRLAAAGVRVSVFEPGRPLDDDTLGDLSLLMNKKVDPASLSALVRAERRGLPTWNGSQTMLLGVRLLGYRLLEEVGLRVPPVFFEPPPGDYVAKPFVDWHFRGDPVLNGEGDLYQEYVAAAHVDEKYYAVDVGPEITVRVLETTSKLHSDEKEPLGLVDPDPDIASRVRRLLRLTGSQAIGVDVVEGERASWAVDVNPAMSFRHTGMEDELAASVLAVLDAADGSAERLRHRELESAEDD